MTKGELTLSRPQYYRDYGKIHGHLGTEIMRNKTLPQKSVKLYKNDHYVRYAYQLFSLYNLS